MIEDPQNLAGGTYTVNVTDDNGCVSTGAITLTAPSAIVLTETHMDVSCNGSTDGKINLNVSGGTPSYQFVWSNNSSTQNITDIPTGLYDVRAIDAQGCSATLSGIFISEPTSLDVSVSVTDVACEGASSGEINTVVSGGTAPYFYQWSNQSNAANLVDAIAGTYMVIATDAHNCTISASATIHTLPQLQVAGVADEVPCANAQGTIDVVVAGGSGPFTYSWSTGAVSEDLINVHPGTYHVTVKDVNGCPFDTTFEVVNTNTFSVSAAGSITTVKLGEFIQLSATSTGSSQTTFNWSPSFGMSCVNCPEVTIQPRQSTVFTVVATDVNGCESQDYVSVEVVDDHGLFVPNAFTPNGDGNNDFFQIFGNTAGIHTFNIMVFNRIGEKIYEASEADFMWDGTYKGEKVPLGVYTYVAKAVFLDAFSDKSLYGSVTILR